MGRGNYEIHGRREKGKIVILTADGRRQARPPGNAEKLPDRIYRVVQAAVRVYHRLNKIEW